MANPLQGGINYNNPQQHQCTWSMTITYVNKDTLQPETLSLKYPLTIDFSIQKNMESSTNTAAFEIYNLSEKTRSNIFQEQFNTGVKKVVTFYAGYGGMDNESLVFKGYIQEAYSQRRGVDMVTVITAWDIGYTESYMTTTFEKGTTFKEAYKHIVSLMSGVELAEIGELEGSFQTPTTFTGTPMEILNKITDYHTFIDNGSVKTLQNNECIDVPVHIIDAESGLIDTPMLRGGQIEINSIFQPSIAIGQLYEIKSITASNFNGTYKVCGYSHSGTISGAVAGQRLTRINLLIGAILPCSNYVITGNLETGFKKVKLEQVNPVASGYGSSVEEVYKYIRENNGQVPARMITNEISWADMIGNNNTSQARLTELTKSKLYNCKTIAEALQRYKNANYPSYKLRVTSGWRSKANNASVRGATGIHGHLYGNAIDFYIGNIPYSQMKNSLNAFCQSNLGSTPYAQYDDKHIHIQNNKAGA